MSDDRSSLPAGMQPMRQVDHVPEPPARAGFWFSGPGWRRWVMAAVFWVLVAASAAVGTLVDGGWVETLGLGAVILAVLLVVNAGLKCLTRHRVQRPRMRA
ncbi:hypothetical protein [Williamsia deligens]|uniref:DUF2631 domain-containing protein n=1 Tax=Williamsia deligens TaxID=321325 RepID=A0ABW3G625_9NOCA|nr:hypothetical protein [Williamsia deligens]MCP2193697.1 hypothetical protein [Williamsia deligens]